MTAEDLKEQLDDRRTEAYLRRIRAERPPRADGAALRTLQERHLRSVPFENLSIHLGEEIRLEPRALVAKVVDGRRGGFCYELNGAFATLLVALGFDVTLLQARVYDGEGLPGIPYDHLTLRVRDVDGGEWLADVGFGAHSLHPLVYDERGEQADPDGVFRIAEGSSGDLDLFRDGQAQFVLDQRPRALRDFTAGAWYHRTSPDSHFTRSLVCSLRTEQGRTTLSGSTLTVTENGERRTTELATDAEVLAAYRDHFGLSLNRLPNDPAKESKESKECEGSNDPEDSAPA
ncbi:arylamine N-acetyltransferase family protein [Streptomyces indicus]|uniref:N-hydroxyarylamine O-acetyltransferase n=1 Tax=Streptomyces indicus TaxID=417292 RepID=A0A1G9DDW6_9ACTN|nr:arylamine N-acetyltransferase [Streptomyces indicus]SDK62078.1 N-hydroxyarylamine O-acetyltransferase [Streptomyces indicus]